MLLHPGRKALWAGGGGRAHQGSCNGDERKDNGKIMSVIRAAMEIKCWNCNGGQRWGEGTCSGLVQISVISLT